MESKRRRTSMLVAAAFLLAFVAWAGALALQQRRAGDAFDITRFEITSLPNKWLYALGAPFRDDLDADEALARYFEAPDRTEPDIAALQPRVEAVIEGRIDAALDELGLGGPLPGVVGVFPPVDVQLTGAPRVLAVSPRDHIVLERTQTLRPELSTGELLALEARTEADDPSISALVVPLGGISTYPAIVSNRQTYEGTLGTAAHEWVHHYLAFYPLGWNALGSSETRTISETVADIVGHEVAALALERFGSPTPPSTPTPTSTSEAGATPEAPAVDINATLRALRIEVDALLAEGRIDEAERRMEEVRLELDAAGYRIRRINQAYFAWYGTYAARPDSVDPLGPQLFDLRERTGSLEAFLDEVRGATSREDVARLLEAAGGTPESLLPVQ
ncbi:MAG: hypothetical protein R3C39_09550 [Dehalococcoidia bacterium]